MALIFSAIKSRVLKVISQQDEALVKNDDFDEVYQKYLEDLDESKLEFVANEHPTYFHLQTASSQKDILAQKDNQSSLAMKANTTGEMPIYSLMCNTVKIALKDITTNGESQFIKGTHGLVSDDIVTWLAANNIIVDLYRALEAKVPAGANDVKKKSEQLSTSTLQITQN